MGTSEILGDLVWTDPVDLLYCAIDKIIYSLIWVLGECC